MATKTEGSKASQANMDVDYVMSYRFHNTAKSEAQATFGKLIQVLATAGLDTEVRNGDNCSVLVFIKAKNGRRFIDHVYHSRVIDWLYGVQTAQPDRQADDSLTPESLTDAERLRIVHRMITSCPAEGGAGINPKQGEWKEVESLFPLHNPTFNKEWIKKWSTTTFLKIEDLDEVRNRFGEKVAFYFAFTQSYFAFLAFPAAFGFSAWVLLGHFSPIYAVFNVFWCVTFVEYWKRQELDLGIRWGVRGVSAIQEKRKYFKPEKEVKDPITGETLHTFSAAKRLGRQALQIPFAILAGAVLGSLIVVCFGIEIFVSEVYSGPMKSILVYLPTGLLTTLTPTLSKILTGVATRLNNFENWDTTDGYESAMTQKIFVLNFITDYLGILLTAFAYIPFGHIIVPHLDVFNLTTRPFAEREDQQVAPKAGFEIDPGRLRKQVIYFTLTAQIVNFAMEVIVPYVKRRGFQQLQKVKTSRAAKRGGAASGESVNDHPDEAEFLARVRSEAVLPVYDVAVDFREMVVQFGYLSLFAVVWPLTPVSFFINNWIELRADAVKICVEMQRPIPFRADSIGSWLDSLGFLAWLGSITTAALVYMFSNDGIGSDGSLATLKGWALLLTIFFSEHIYLIVRLAVRLALSKLESPGLQKEHAERYMVRKRYLEEILGDHAMELPSTEGTEKITRTSLEEGARQGSLKTTVPSNRFWARQRGWEETVKVGSGLIDMMAPDETKKQK